MEEYLIVRRACARTEPEAVARRARIEVSGVTETIEISEGPKRLGDGVSCFARDPDRNVIEFRQVD